MDVLAVMGLTVLVIGVLGLVAGGLATLVRRRSLQSRVTLLDRETMLAEARIDALTRRTLQAMRDAVREEHLQRQWNGRM